MLVSGLDIYTYYYIYMLHVHAHKYHTHVHTDTKEIRLTEQLEESGKLSLSTR